MRVIIAMIFVEPTEAYETRSPGSAEVSRTRAGSAKKAFSLRELCGPLACADGWDERILAHVGGRSGEPVLIMSIPSQLRKLVRHRNKQHKERLKRGILIRIG